MFEFDLSEYMKNYPHVFSRPFMETLYVCGVIPKPDPNSDISGLKQAEMKSLGMAWFKSSFLNALVPFELVRKYTYHKDYDAKEKDLRVSSKILIQENKDLQSHLLNAVVYMVLNDQAKHAPINFHNLAPMLTHIAKMLWFKSIDDMFGGELPSANKVKESARSMRKKVEYIVYKPGYVQCSSNDTFK